MCLRRQKYDALETSVSMESRVRHSFVQFWIERNVCEVRDERQVWTYAVRLLGAEMIPFEQFEVRDVEEHGVQDVWASMFEYCSNFDGKILDGAKRTQRTEH